MNVPCKFETTAFQGQKENRTKEQSFNITSMKFFWQVRWIDQIQYPISLVASLDTVPVICCAPLLRLYCKMDKTFSASTRKINKWTCERPEVRAAPRNRFIYCQNIAKVMLVQVLLLLRSSTHTHPAVPGYFILFLGKQLTKKIQSHVSVFPEFVVHGYVGQEIEGQGVLGQLRVVVV